MSRSNTAYNEPVTAVFTWKVQAGKEELFQKLMHDVHKVARTFPGHMGVTLLKSPQEKNDFQMVLRFDTARHLDNWLSSPERQTLMVPIAEIAGAKPPAKASGLETWFELPGQVISPPPKWKMVIVTLIAIYPLSLLYALFVAPHTVDWFVLLRALILPVCAPIILTYLFMPFLTQHAFRRWLYPSSKR